MGCRLLGDFRKFIKFFLIYGNIFVCVILRILRNVDFFLGEWFLRLVEWKILILFNVGFFKYVIIDVYCLYSDKNC